MYNKLKYGYINTTLYYIRTNCIHHISQTLSIRKTHFLNTACVNLPSHILVQQSQLTMHPLCYKMSTNQSTDDLMDVSKYIRRSTTRGQRKTYTHWP